MVKLSPDLNYMSLKTPLGNNIRVDCQAVDDFENAKKTTLVFDLIRNIHSLLRLKGMNAEKLFKRIDKDNSGSISAVEMWDGLLEFGIKWTRSEFDLLYEKFDSDGDDNIDIHEFLRIVDPEYVKTMILERVTIDDVVVMKEREHKAIHETVVQSNKNKTRKKTVSKKEWLEDKKSYDIKDLRKELKLQSTKFVKKKMKKRASLI